MNDKRNQLLINVLTWVVLLTPVWALLYGLYVFDHGFGVIALTAFLFFLPVYIGYILSSTTEAVYKDNNLTYKLEQSQPNKNYGLILPSAGLPAFLWFLFWFGLLMISLAEIISFPYWLSWPIIASGVFLVCSSLVLLLWFWAEWKKSDKKIISYDTVNKVFSVPDFNFSFKDIKSICFRTSFLFFTSNAEITTRFGKVCFTGRLIKPSAKDMANSKGTYGYGMVVEVDEDVVAPGLKTVRNFFMVNKVVVKSGTERWILYFFAITVFLLLQFGDRLVFLLTKFVTN